MMGKIYSNNLNYSPTLLFKDSEGCNEYKNGDKHSNLNDKDRIPLNKKACDVIKKALRMVCETGTARNSCHTSYGISGKTEGAQKQSGLHGDLHFYLEGAAGCADDQ
jgi:cell division protein FtsI/penicillin-binding protein 2